MDWYTILYAARWVILSLFLSVLLVVLITVYREASSHLEPKSKKENQKHGRLKVIEPGSDKRIEAGILFDLKTTTSLGSDGDNDVVLGDQYVSGHHLRLSWDGALWWLEDLHSKNGTLVNRKPCSPEHPQVLPMGAFINIGDMVMELVE